MTSYIYRADLPPMPAHKEGPATYNNDRRNRVYRVAVSRVFTRSMKRGDRYIYTAEVDSECDVVEAEWTADPSPYQASLDSDYDALAGYRQGVMWQGKYWDRLPEGWNCR